MNKNVFDWLYDNRESILSAYDETGGSPKKTWERLTVELPEIESIMKFNSFRTYLKPVAEMLKRTVSEMDTFEDWGDLNKVQETTEGYSTLVETNKELRAENKRLLDKIQKMLEGPQKSTNIRGWTLAKTGNYFRLFKKIDGKVKGIHLGKVFDREKAIEKIKAKEKELGIAPKNRS